MGNTPSANQECSPIVVHVIYQAYGTQRTIHLPSGSTLSDLVEKFLKVFNDVIPSGSKASDFKFLVYNSEKSEFIGFNPDVALKEDDRVKVEYILKALHSPVLPHPIKDNQSYYFWSTYSNGLLKLDNSKSKLTVKSDGIPTDDTKLIHFKAVDVSTAKATLCALTLPASTQGKVYVMKGQDENQDVVMEEMDGVDPKTLPDEYRFECPPFYGDTQFRCNRTASGRTDLYITAMKDGTTKLQKAGLQGYPRPNTLFIASNIV